MISLATWLERHARRRTTALQAASEGPVAAASAIADAFALHRSAVSPIATNLLTRPPLPDARARTGLLLPADAIPPLGFADGTDLSFREAVCRRCAPSDEDSATLRLAWATAALLGHAQDHQDHHRDAWREVRYGAHPHDPQTLRLLAGAGRGQRWEIRAPLGKLTWPICQAVFRGGLRGLHLPNEVQTEVLDRLKESWSFLLVAGSKEDGPALPEILLRTVETLGEQGPVQPVARLLAREDWERLTADLAHGRWRGPLSRLYRTPRGALARTACISEAWNQDKDRFEADMRAVMVLRLLTLWARRSELTFPLPSWRRFEAGYSRGRARLRASAVDRMDQACTALIASASPFSRLSAALRRYAYALFWVEAERNFPGTSSAAPRPPDPAPAGQAELLPTPEAMGALQGWVLLAVLRGDGALVAGWRDRTIGKVAGNWDRRQKELQAPLQNPPEVWGCHRLARLSLALAAAPELLGTSGEPGAALMPFLKRIAALPTGDRLLFRKIKDILSEASRPGPGPEPESGAPSMVKEARKWRRRGHSEGGET